MTEVRRPGTFAADVLNTAVTSLVTMVALVVITRWMATALSSEGFGVYGLSRRLATSVAIYSNVVGLSLTRFLAMDADRDRRDAFLLAGLLCALVPAVVLLAVVVGLPTQLASLAFHDPGLGAVLIATVLLVIGTAGFNVAYAHFRGVGRVGIGNAIQVLVVALVPLGIVYAFASEEGVALVNGLTGAAMAAALLFVGRQVVTGARRATVRRQVGARVRDLVRYGLPRVPGGFAFGALLAVGPYVAPRFGGMEQAGFLVAGQSLLRIVEAGTAAFGVVALPRVAGLLARGQHDFLRARSEDLIAMALHVGLFATLQLLVWSDVIVLAWLGPRYAAAVPVVAVMLLAAAPYLTYTILRSVVDALDERAVNTWNCVIAFFVTLGASLVAGWLGYGGRGLAAAGALGLAVLGGLSARYVWGTLRLEVAALAMGRGLLAIGAAGIPTIGARMLTGPEMPAVVRLLVAAGAAVVSVGVFGLVLQRTRVRWIQEVSVRARGMLKRG